MSGENNKVECEAVNVVANSCEKEWKRKMISEAWLEAMRRSAEYGVTITLSPEHAVELFGMIPASNAQGGEAAEVVAWLVEGLDQDVCTANRRVMMDWANSGYEIKPLMTVAQHERIVAAKDAEIARIKVWWKETTDAGAECMKERDQLHAKLAAQQGAVLPERKFVGPHNYGLEGRAEVRGWNACLDEVARLNGGTP